ncbi:MAG: DUF1398 family protein [Flavobacteriaceae bacterium]|nr:DUF1398 family protein [Flavobacteriaceae bacterium]
MFAIEQIEQAHEKVKSGTDFPKYLQEIKVLGLKGFETCVKDSPVENLEKLNQITENC